MGSCTRAPCLLEEKKERFACVTCMRFGACALCCHLCIRGNIIWPGEGPSCPRPWRRTWGTSWWSRRKRKRRRWRTHKKKVIAGFQKGAEKMSKKKCGSKKERKRLKAKRKQIEAFGKEEKGKKVKKVKKAKKDQKDKKDKDKKVKNKGNTRGGAPALQAPQAAAQAAPAAVSGRAAQRHTTQAE